MDKLPYMKPTTSIREGKVLVLEDNYFRVLKIDRHSMWLISGESILISIDTEDDDQPLVYRKSKRANLKRGKYKTVVVASK